MSDTRKRDAPSLAGLQLVQDQALDVLRSEGWSDDAIRELFAEPLGPREQTIEPRLRPLPQDVFNTWVEQGRQGDPVARYYVAREIIRDFGDAAALGWKRPRGRDPIQASYERWARAVLVCFLACGDVKRRDGVMDRVAQLVGVGSKASLEEKLPDVWLWGGGIPDWFRAVMAVRACRIIMERPAKK